ncbi:ABC transporter ATP-binding protein [Deinococcus sp. YIM 77859]|uniref:ABC transporter ATP-binding protein n=1 Tax=Deinococcus sp. YIM 77859 TaxID=1540221 RepID=UPI000691F8FE|nr:ABC transporter ATP-binding protein [Deinococcus sp. YIM 77859]
MRKQPEVQPLAIREQLTVLARALPALFRSAPGLVVLMGLMVVVQGLTPTATILLSKWTVDGISRAVQGGETNLTLLALAWAGTALLTQLAQVASTVLQGYAADHFTVQTVTSLMHKMRELPGLDVVEDPRFHDDVETLQVGARFRPLNLTATLLGLLRSLVSVVGVAGTLLTVGWWVPLVVVLGMLPLARTQIRLRELGWSLAIQRTQEARELAYDQRVAMRHEYAKEVRLYDLMPYLTSRYVSKATAYQRVMRAVRNRQVLGVLPAQALALGVTAGLFAYAVAQAEAGVLTAGTVVLVIGALAQVREGLGSVTEYLGMGTEHLRWFQKYYAFLDARPGVAPPETPRPLPARLDLTLEHVSFAYGGQPALEDISLDIPEGQVVAIVGENGAGKTTLVKLLLRFYDPTAGRILVGGPGEATDLRDLDPTAWRCQVAAVFQDFARFEWTLRENVLLGRPEDAFKLAQAARASGLDTVLPRLAAGLNTRLGQAFGGVDLSGGQWQKLATARALYRDARILILDEPTAALDPRSESEVFAAFAALARGRTTLLITHRLGSVLMADRILVMRAGRLIEDGTHAELLAQGGEYAELWRMQAGQYLEEKPARETAELG